MAPAADKIGPRGPLSLDAYQALLEHANIENSLNNLMTFPRLARMIERGEVSIHGAYFGVASGELYVLENGRFARVTAGTPTKEALRF